MAPINSQTPDSSLSLSELPLDELKAYASELGITSAPDAREGELLRLIRARQETLLELERDALLDICVWALLPVRQSASKEQLAKTVTQVRKMRFEKLSDRGLQALCKLQGAPEAPDADREQMIRSLKSMESVGSRVQRKLRRGLGSLISNMVYGNRSDGETDQAYRFLPESQQALKENIEENGVVGGITRKLKGAADDYVREKLDEIEARIDHKLDEIDARLGEWRDREIRNRLRIIKITLIASIIVALLSLGYDYVKDHMS